MAIAVDLSSGFVDDQSSITGSWPGLVLNYGALVVFTGSEALLSGSWFGSNQTRGVNGASHENHDVANTTDDEFPNVGEGINIGEYNPPPVLLAEPEEPQKIRDATRYKKSYSFTRNQPVRIRVFRR